MWKKVTWASGGIETDALVGGTPVRLTYPDGNIVVGKVSVEPSLHQAGARGEVIMARIVTPHCGDTFMNVAPADIEVWETDAFDDATAPR